METSNCDVYQVFMCDDKCTSQSHDTRHNYLIIGVEGPEKGLGLVQAMSITSMQDKEVKIEVPVKLSNNMVSYILPYNIHSFKPKDFSIRDYNGSLRDTSYCTRKDFVDLLMRLYIDSLGVNAEYHDKVMEDYHNYCIAFWENNKDCKEYRDERIYYKDNIVSTQSITIENDKEEDISPVIETKTSEFKRDFSKYDKVFKQVTNKTTKKKMNNKKRKENRREQRSIQEMMRSCIGSITHEETKKEEEDNTTVVIKQLKVPYKSYDVVLEDMLKLKDLSNQISKWTDEDIILFMKGYKKFGYKNVNQILPNKWKSASRISTWYSTCVKESIARELPPISPLKQLTKPISSWKDSEIRYYLSLMKNHKNDEQFMLDVTGYENIDMCQKTTYEVRQEANKRKLFTK